MPRDLIRTAEAALRPKHVGDRLFGNVAAALDTTSGQRHVGVCIDTGSGTGFCAEHAAIAAMVTSGDALPESSRCGVMTRGCSTSFLPVGDAVSSSDR